MTSQKSNVTFYVIFLVFCTNPHCFFPSLIAHALAKVHMDEDREILQSQYKDISEELHTKTEVLRRYKHRVKQLEKEIRDIYGEFEEERQDYLETIRKQEMNAKLLSQIAERLAATVKKECNYR